MRRVTCGVVGWGGWGPPEDGTGVPKDKLSQRTLPCCFRMCVGERTWGRSVRKGRDFLNFFVAFTFAFGFK